LDRDLRRTHRREADRWLLWAIVAKSKPLSSLNVAEYCEQLVPG
jgi:hypothetical protein